MELDRRAALAAAGALGVGLTTACTREPERTEGGEQEVSANEDLMREHGVLRRILILYRETAPKAAAGATIDVEALASAATLFRDFGEQYHERQLEEAYIFPELRKGELRGLVDTLLTQHQRGRNITGFILDATKNGRIDAARSRDLAQAMTSFARMYEAHAAWEDTVLFAAFKTATPPDRMHELSERFEDIEHRQFGQDGFDAAVKRIAQAETALGISDLDSFTAPVAA